MGAENHHTGFAAIRLASEQQQRAIPNVYVFYAIYRRNALLRAPYPNGLQIKV
jgi:hypothetical protein